MPSSDSVSSLKPSYSPSSIPTAIFVGGTSGIGQAMAESFAQATKGKCNIIIIGRNRAAAESIIASFPKSSAPSDAILTHEFIECDVSLIKNVRTTTAALLARLKKVNFLVLTTGVLRFSGRRETVEGIDEKLALTYYARWAFTNDLMPLLKGAKDAGEDAKVMSVFGAGSPLGVEADVNDLGMVKNYGGILAVRVVSTYNDLMLEKFSALNPSISFTHSFPGAVFTNLIRPKTFPYNLLTPLIYALMWPFSVSQSTCAQYMWQALHDVGAGFHRRGEKGQDLEQAYYKCTDEAREALWLHTVEATKTKLD